MTVGPPVERVPDPSVAVYEARAPEWHAERAPKRRRHGRFVAKHRLTGRAVVDLGCGPGWDTAALGPPAIALDAAHAMLREAAEVAPDAPPLRADLRSLPFRTRSLGGALASRSYVHLPRSEVPMALADLHRSLEVGSPIELVVFRGDAEHAPHPEDDFPGRLFSHWPADLFLHVVEGAGFASPEVHESGADRLTVCARRARTLADTVGPDMRVLVCGLNPSRYAADAGVGFARPGNRFWPAALAAGIVDRDRDPVHALAEHGVGMTDLVKRATPRADELAPDEYRAGFTRVERLLGWLGASVLCVVGLTGWRAAVDRSATPGWQHDRVAGTPVYLMPSTSGLNAHASLADLTEHLRRAARGP